MTWIEDIGEYLQTNSIGTLSDNMFYHGFDLKASNCIALLVAPGLPEKTTLGRTYTLSRPELDIRVRNVDDSEAESTAKAIQTLLSQVTMQTIGSTRFKRIRPLQDYYFLETDENNRFIYVINFQTEING